MFSLFFQERFADDITHNKELEKEKKLLETGLFSEEEIDFVLENKDFEYDDFDEDDESNYIPATEAFKKWMAILDL